MFGARSRRESPVSAVVRHLEVADLDPSCGQTQSREALERILAWDFDRVVIAHGDLIERDAKSVLRRAWRATLV